MHRDRDLLADRFQESRGQLRAVAYRMLGSLSEADDAVQETWLRLNRSDASGVRNLTGWLTTVVGRICLDMLRSRSVRREEPMADAYVPDPVVSPLEHVDPEQEDGSASRHRRPDTGSQRRRRSRGRPDRGPAGPARRELWRASGGVVP